jgi:hemoglobin
MTKIILLALLAFAPLLASPSIASAQDYDFAAPRTLFERLGGMPAITGVVDELLQRVGQDPRIRQRFINAHMANLRARLIEQICGLSGGGCPYQGRDMKTVHRGMGITGADFDALMQDLVATLNHWRVPAREQSELLALLGPTKADIVEVSGAASRGAGPQPTPMMAPAPPARPAPTGPVAERAQSLREAASLLERAETERAKGNRSLAEQLFSFAELIVGVDTLAALANLFRDGAPPRVTTAPVAVSLQTPPQPPAVGNSDEEEPEPRPAKGSLAGTLTQAGAGYNGFAVVTLEPASGRFHRRKPRHRVVEQRNRQFAPRVLVVPVGSTVAFPNFDSIYHNVFSRSAVHPFDLGLYKAGQEREIRFEKEGVVRIGCNLHANMSAVVAVVSAPYYAVTDAQGRFTFRSLAPGNYRVRVYTEGSDEPTVQPVRIDPERNTITVALTAASSAGPLADKFGVARVQKSAR